MVCFSYTSRLIILQIECQVCVSRFVFRDLCFKFSNSRYLDHSNYKNDDIFNYSINLFRNCSVSFMKT